MGLGATAVRGHCCDHPLYVGFPILCASGRYCPAITLLGGRAYLVQILIDASNLPS